MNGMRWGCCRALLACLLLLGAGCASDRQLMIEELRELGYDPEETERGVVIFLPDVLFEFDRAELTEDGLRKIDDVAALLQRVQTYDLLSVEGHADAVGEEAYNLDLSELRARTVADALTGAGIDPERVEATGFGETRPLVPNRTPEGRDDPEARRKNRRVEMVLLMP